MDLQNVDVFDYNLRGEDIKPSNETKMMANIAASNGFVKGKGYNEGGKVIEESTLDHPLKDSVRYNPDIESPSEVFRGKAFSMMSKIRGWMNEKR